MKSLFLRTATIVLLVVSTACAPRGEIQSLDELLALAKTRYRNAGTEGLDPETTQTLTQLTGSLTTLEKFSTEKGDVREASKTAEMLNKLSQQSGYTSRPAFAELITQYRLVGAERDRAEATDPAVTLLVSRTYTLLARELETTRFRNAAATG